jgi:predicted nucleotidyltransferase component of viral defense system
MSDNGASVLAKLKNKARSNDISFQQCLQLFFQEEFLRKLSMSKYVDNLILKGGLFIYNLTNFESRATIDIDFLLRQLPSSVDEVKGVIEDIIKIDTGNDYIEMTSGSYEEISQQRKYKGVSMQIIGRIKNVKVPFNVDIGVGDIISPKSLKRKINTQLIDFKTPEISTYSLESTIAEKFDAILQRYELTGRMKDFYDIFYLSKKFEFDGRELQIAINETLKNRNTYYDKTSFERIIKLVDDSDMQIKWRYFLKHIKNEQLDFEVVVNGIKNFLEPVFMAIIKDGIWQKNWSYINSEWS